MSAIDVDEGKNGEIEYTLQYVSNNGKEKFAIGPTTGVVKANGHLNPGELYTLTIKVFKLLIIYYSKFYDSLHLFLKQTIYDQLNIIEQIALTTPDPDIYGGNDLSFKLLSNFLSTFIGLEWIYLTIL